MKFPFSTYNHLTFDKSMSFLESFISLFVSAAVAFLIPIFNYCDVRGARLR